MPLGIPPRKASFEETDTIMSHTWPFFNAQFPTAEASTCADHVELYKNSSSMHESDIPGYHPSANTVRISPNSFSMGLGIRASDRKFSLRVNRSRSFSKGDSSTNGPSIAQKSYKTFSPGDYMYGFELPLDSHLPETIDVELGSVKYELEATVERAGTFKTNLVGTKEVVLIRAPSEASLEQSDPIVISQEWEDRLHYDIIISGRSFPLGTQIPIALKLTPLAKVQCHSLKVLVTENIEYCCNSKRAHRAEPTRKLQLFEKRAEGSHTSTYPGSTMRIISGGGLPYDQRAAAARGEEVATTNNTNLLGNLEGEEDVGPTEMEFNVRLPSCINMRDKEKGQKLHCDTTYQNIQVHHWIKVSIERMDKRWTTTKNCSRLLCVCLNLTRTIQQSGDSLSFSSAHLSASSRARLHTPTPHCHRTHHQNRRPVAHGFTNVAVQVLLLDVAHPLASFRPRIRRATRGTVRTLLRASAAPESQDLRKPTSADQSIGIYSDPCTCFERHHSTHLLSKMESLRRL